MKIIRFLKLFLLISIVISNHKLLTTEKPTHLKALLASSTLRAELSLFMDHVLRQVPASDFWNLIDQIDWESCPDDHAIYKKIMTKIYTIKPQIQLFRKLAALKHQKKILTDQALQLLAQERKFSGAIEIGSPGAYLASLQNQINISSDIYVINDNQSATDIFQAFTPSGVLNGFVPNNKFVALNHYLPISPNLVPNQSVDLIICYIGLHHIPKEKLANFIASMARVLKPNGILLLREHDAHTSDLVTLTSAAHTIFNAIMNGEKISVETAEYRNFQPLTYWIDLLEKQQLKLEAGPLLQIDDPTRNSLLKFRKTANSLAEHLDQLSRDTQNSDAAYKRDLTQSYLTTPEWINVDVSEEYAQFINHTPFYKFPYMQSVKTYWQCFGDSWRASAKRNGHWKTLTSPCTLTNMFVGTSMTLEYAAKSLISVPMRLVYEDSEPKTLTVILQDRKLELHKLDKSIKIIKKLPTNNLVTVELPRYQEFLKTVRKLQNSTIIIHEIAGQREIQLKLRFMGTKEQFTTACPYELEATWQLPTKPNYIYATITVPVNQLLIALNKLDQDSCELLFIHDF